MEIVLGHLYKVPVPFVPARKDSERDLRKKGSVENFFLELEVLEAADKVCIFH